MEGSSHSARVAALAHLGNPLSGIKKPHEKNPRRPLATWERFNATRSAVQHLVSESKTDVERRKWLKLEMTLVLAEATGRRLGSIRQLEWSDVDLNAETIHWRADTDKKGAAGGWSDLTTLLRCYQQADEDTLLAVMNEPRKVTERVKNA